MAAYWLAFLAVAVCGDCVDDGVCALRNSYHYKTLDGTLRNETTVGCHDTYTAIPAHWELADHDTDAPVVAGEYKWGTHAIVHGPVNSGQWTTTKGSSRRRSYTSWTILTSSNGAGETTYRPRYCDARLLIRQVAEVNCTRGKGLPLKRVGLKADCSECAAGRSSHGGMNAACIPFVASAAAQLSSSPPYDFRAESDDFGVVRLSLFAASPPEVTYEGFHLQYAFDIKPNESNLDLEGTSPCQEKHWSSTTDVDNMVSFKTVLTYTDLNRDCNLSLVTNEDIIERKGMVGVALIIKDADGAYQGTVMTWHFPILVHFAASMRAIYENPIEAAESLVLHGQVVHPAAWADTELTLFQTNAFGSQVVSPVYEAGERAFIELALNDFPGLVMTPILAWISVTRDPASAMLHNLTDSIEPLSDGASKAKFSIILQVCANCYLHILGEITSNRRLGYVNGNAIGEERHLESSLSHHTLLTVPITVMEVEESASGGGGGGGGGDGGGFALIAIIIGAVVAVLLIACATCFFVKRIKPKPPPVPVPPPAPPPPRPRPDPEADWVPRGPDAPFPLPVHSNAPQEPRIIQASAEIKAELDKLFAAAEHVGEGGRDVKHPGTYKKLRCVEAWKLEIPNLETRYKARRTVIQGEVKAISTEKFRGEGIPHVHTQTDLLREHLHIRPDFNETVLLHGTKMEYVLAVALGGLSSLLSGGLFGDGAYLAENAGKSDQYVTPLTKTATDDASKQLRADLFENLGLTCPAGKEIFFTIICKVTLGFPVYTMDGERALDNPPTETFLPAGEHIFDRRELVTVPDVRTRPRYHSLIAECRPGGKVMRFREFVVPRDEGIVPCYLAAYVREK